MTASTPIRKLMLPLDGCVFSNSARDVVDVMDATGLRYMPVVSDYRTRRITGAVARDDLGIAMRVRGEDAARVRDARLLGLPLVGPDLPVGRLEEDVGLAAAYFVAEGDRLLGLYDPGAAPH